MLPEVPGSLGLALLHSIGESAFQSYFHVGISSPASNCIKTHQRIASVTAQTYALAPLRGTEGLKWPPLESPQGKEIFVPFRIELPWWQRVFLDLCLLFDGHRTKEAPCWDFRHRKGHRIQRQTLSPPHLLRPNPPLKPTAPPQEASLRTGGKTSRQSLDVHFWC